MMSGLLGLQGVTMAAPAPTATPSLEARVMEFAQQGLLDQAQREGLLEPQLQIGSPGTRGRAISAPPCPVAWQIQVQDTRFLSRLRYSAHCPATGTSLDFVLRAQLSAEVLVATQSVSSGRALTQDDVELQRRDITNAPEAVSQFEAVLGLSPRNSLRAGQILQKRQLQAAILVRRGEKVRILARNAGIEVQAPGEALEPGARDALIKVRNSASGRTITARVLEAGLVEPAER